MKNGIPEYDDRVREKDDRRAIAGLADYYKSQKLDDEKSMATTTITPAMEMKSRQIVVRMRDGVHAETARLAKMAMR